MAKSFIAYSPSATGNTGDNFYKLIEYVPVCNF
jgi:hypothetical protein